MSELLTNLNDEQLRAVTHQGGPLLIVAGAGTGKTTVITRRIAWLIEQRLAGPEEILALTFTEKAAEEMKERVDLLMPLGYTDMWISTFHSFGQRLLQRHGLDIGLPHDFDLLDETRQWMLIQKNLDKFTLDYYRPMGNPHKFISALLQHFSRCKDECISPEEYLQFAESVKLSSGSADLGPAEDAAVEANRLSELAGAYHFYQKLLLEHGALDFGDLIIYPLELFKKRPNILTRYRQTFKYILIDEFQDTNIAQYELVRLLSGSGDPKQNLPSLTVVGDDDQGIFKFRGASVSNILKFREHYPGLTQVTLVQNYRSSQEILDLAYGLIQHNNPDRLEVKMNIDKRLRNPSPRGSSIIEVIEAPDLTGEIAAVIKKIISIKTENPASSWNDFAVLIRSRAASDELLPRLEASGIPFTYLNNTGLYRKRLIVRLTSYLKLLDNYHESSSLYQVLNFPKFRLPSEDLALLTQYAGKHILSLYETLKKAIGNEGETAELNKISPIAKKNIAALLTLVAEHAGDAQTASATELFVDIVKDLGVGQMLSSDTLENAQNRELLEQFYKRLEIFERQSEDKSIKAFLAELELEKLAGGEGEIKFDPEAGPESLKILTVHAAKGLEFENVFIINLVDQRFPSREKAAGIEIPEALIKDILPEGDAHLEEERRLFYVAITRAKKRLYLSWARDYGGARAKQPSLFLQETGLVPSEKVNQATGKVVFSAPKKDFTRQVYKKLPTVFSYSALSAFKKCPLEYKIVHYLKLPVRGTHYFSFGVSIHATLQKYMEEYQSLSSQTDLFGQNQPLASLPPLSRLLEIYQHEWRDEWYQTKLQKQEFREKGRQILQSFYERSAQNLPQLEFVEKRFSLPCGQFRFVGKIDRADKTPEGLAIIDYKTGKPPKRQTDENMDQLRIYQLACQEQFQKKVASLRYWYLDDGTFRDIDVANQEDIAELRDSLMQTMQEIREAVQYDKFAQLHAKSKQHKCEYEEFV